jgi:hypothetical protein
MGPPMSRNRFDPEKFIDREFELELFQELLSCNGTTRILAIKDRSGTGKSQLLKRLDHYCRTIKPRIPVSLIPWDQLPDRSPIFLTSKIFEHLSALGVSFDTYSNLDNARIRGDLNAFGAWSKIDASVHLCGVDFAAAHNPKIAGVIYEMPSVQVANIYSSGGILSPDQQRMAQAEVINAFFHDLNAYCSDHPVVLMFDSYERGGEELQTWLEKYLLERSFFSFKPSKLLLVLAGQRNPQFHSMWPKADCDLLVRSVDRLGKWSKKDIEQFLRVNGFKCDPAHVEVLLNCIETLDVPLSGVVDLMQLYKSMNESDYE